MKICKKRITQKFIPYDEYAKMTDIVQKQLGNHISSVNTVLTLVSVLVLVVSVSIPIINYAWANNELVESLVSRVDEKISDMENFADIQSQLTRAKTNISYVEKLQIYKTLIDKYPNKKEGYEGRGILYFDNGNYKEAIDDFLKAEFLGTNETEYINYIGRTYDCLEDMDNAVKYYFKALNIALNKKENTDYLYSNIGLAYSKNSNPEIQKQAMTYYEKAISDNKKYSPAYCHMGDFLYNAGNLSEALENYNKAIEYDPKSSRAYGGRGNIFFAKKKYKEAMSDYNINVVLNPKDSTAYCRRGNAYRELHILEHALEDYNAAIAFNTKNSNAFNGRGNVFYDLGDIERAFDDYNKAILLDSENSHAYNGLGNVYRTQEKYEVAIEEYNKAITLDSRNSMFYSNLGYVMLDINDFDSAIEAFNKAMQIDPHSSEYFMKDLQYAIAQKKFELSDNDYLDGNSTMKSQIYLGRYYSASKDLYSATPLDSTYSFDGGWYDMDKVNFIGEVFKVGRTDCYKVEGITSYYFFPVGEYGGKTREVPVD